MPSLLTPTSTPTRTPAPLQDDLLYQSLTVRETLYYAAMLRLPCSMSTEDKMARIDTVISALGLGACQDTIIGGFFRKGISGGEWGWASLGRWGGCAGRQAGLSGWPTGQRG